MLRRVKGLWDEIKAGEKAGRGGQACRDTAGALAGVPLALPAPHPRAQASGESRKGRLRLERSVGGRWQKSAKRADEIAAAIEHGDRNEIAGEVGDLLFAVVNLARHLAIDPEAALRATNAKFERRFAAIEQALARKGKVAKDASLAEMEALWEEAKASERATKGK